MNVLLRSLLTLSLTHDDAYTNAVTCLFSFIPTKYYEIYIYEKQEARHLMRFSFFCVLHLIILSAGEIFLAIILDLKLYFYAKLCQLIIRNNEIKGFLKFLQGS